MMDIQSIKQRFGIIGNSPLLDRAIDIARQVAATDLTVLITGESGTGKEVFPKIIHHLSARKHGPYIAVNCGAIPEGTIDSELFGHEKGAFTGAHEARKGYFEVVDGGTIFLDEVAELPLSTQVRLLRVLETGEFIRVGSSKVLKTDVRVVAATNVHIPDYIAKGKFREDLYYRLNTVPIYIPPLRERKEDILILFKKFSSDFAQKYRMPPLELTDDAKEILIKYPWYGNVRQLKNIAEQISIIEEKRLIDADTLKHYLPDFNQTTLPVHVGHMKEEKTSMLERELLYKFLLDMKNDVNELKRLLHFVIEKTGILSSLDKTQRELIATYIEPSAGMMSQQNEQIVQEHNLFSNDVALHHLEEHEEEITAEPYEETLSLEEKEKELIRKALQKHRGKRKLAAKELGISERTLYRKIKAYQLHE